MANPRTSLLGLPRELQVWILSYVLDHGGIVTMTKGGKKPRTIPKPRKIKRKKKASNARIYKPKPRKPTSDPQVLQTCREMHILGFALFWGRGTFTFGTYEHLREWLDFAPEILRACIPSIYVGHGEFAVRYDDSFKNPERVIGWPSTLDFLQPLTKLTSLTLLVGSLWRGPVRPEHREAIWGPEPIFRPHGVPNYDDRLGGHCARDALLLTIPQVVLDQLNSLKMSGGATWWETLPYARDLHARKWRIDPFKSEREVPTFRESCESLCWAEARAAVYWNCERPQLSLIGMDWEAQTAIRSRNARNRMQWCTWAQEWTGICSSTSSWPRKWEEIFDEEGRLRDDCLPR